MVRHVKMAAVWDSARVGGRDGSSIKDSELHVKGVNDRSSQNRNELLVEVSVRPGEAAEFSKSLLAHIPHLTRRVKNSMFGYL